VIQQSVTAVCIGKYILHETIGLFEKNTVFARVQAAFLTRIYLPILGCGLCTGYYVLFTTEPATPVLYVVKLQVETAGV
jgi:hypothetical protein